MTVYLLQYTLMIKMIVEGKGITLLLPPPLRTGLDTFTSSGSSLFKALWKDPTNGIESIISNVSHQIDQSLTHDDNDTIYPCYFADV